MEPCYGTRMLMGSVRFLNVLPGMDWGGGGNQLLKTDLTDILIKNQVTICPWFGINQHLNYCRQKQDKEKTPEWQQFLWGGMGTGLKTLSSSNSLLLKSYLEAHPKSTAVSGRVLVDLHGLFCLPK